MPIKINNFFLLKALFYLTLNFQFSFTQSQIQTLNGISRLDVLPKTSSIGSSSSLLYSSSSSIIYLPSSISFLKENNFNVNSFWNQQIGLVNTSLSFAHKFNKITFGGIFSAFFLQNIPLITTDNLSVRTFSYYYIIPNISYKIGKMSISGDITSSIGNVLSKIIANGDLGISYTYNVNSFYKFGISWKNIINIFLNSVALPNNIIFVNTFYFLKKKLQFSSGIIWFTRNNETIFSTSLYTKLWKIWEIYTGF